MARRFSKIKTTLELDDCIRFGKYSGTTLEKLILLDPEYVDWAVKQPNLLCVSETVAKQIKDKKDAVIAQRALDIQHPVYVEKELDWDLDVPF